MGFLWVRRGGATGPLGRIPRQGPEPPGRLSVPGDGGGLPFGVTAVPGTGGTGRRRGGGGRSDVSEAGLLLHGSCFLEYLGGGPPFRGWKRCPRGPRSSVPERRTGALLVPCPRPAAVHVWAVRSGGAWARVPAGGQRGRSDVIRGGARCPHRGVVGAARTFPRRGPATRWTPRLALTDKGGASGPPGRIPGRGPRARWAYQPTERGGARGRSDLFRGGARVPPTGRRSRQDLFLGRGPSARI